jgi:hypothetical protein
VKNPVELVPPGERGEVRLAADVLAHVLRGARPGPIVWAWAPRGEQDPSMAQALGELRDRIDPERLAGALGLLPHGPPPPIGREQYPWAGPIRAICDGAQAVVLLESMLPGYQAAAHVALELDDKPSRAIARALGCSYIAPHLVTPPPNRAVVSAPAVVWLDGEYERLERPVIDRAERALRSLLATLGMIDEAPAQPPVRVVLKAIADVDAGGAGLVEPAVAPGALVRLGEVVAYAGEPGLRRRALKAPATGVVLYARAGQLTGGAVLGIGKLKRALPSVLRAHAPRPEPTFVEIGWCERVTLPELGITLKAKIDTGARTSALHVTQMRDAGESALGRPLLDIDVPAGRGKTRTARVEVVEQALVRDSGGHAERRPVIETLLGLGGKERKVRVTLTFRGDMLFPMLVGRTALTPEIRVHPTRRFLLR